MKEQDTLLVCWASLLQSFHGKCTSLNRLEGDTVLLSFRCLVTESKEYNDFILGDYHLKSWP